MTTKRFLVLATIWTLVAFGILQLHNVRFDHAVCLPGRCGPPLGAILAVHCFWLLAIGTAVFIALYWLPNLRLRGWGTALLVCALVGMLVVVVWDYREWQPASYLMGKPEVSTWSYHVHRFFFPIVTMTDVPWLQLATAGLVLILCHPQRTSVRQEDG